FFIAHRTPSLPPVPYPTLFRSAGAGFQRLFGGAEGGFLGVVHLFGVVLADAAAQVGKVGLDAVLLVLADLLFALGEGLVHLVGQDRKSTRLNSSHVSISYAVFC